VLLADQFCRIVQFAPSNSHHLYEYGAVPFVAVAVNVIGVPTSCGAVRLAVRLDSVSGARERDRQRIRRGIARRVARRDRDHVRAALQRHAVDTSSSSYRGRTAAAAIVGPRDLRDTTASLDVPLTFTVALVAVNVDATSAARWRPTGASCRLRYT
jgi:hypothetical protein